MSQIDADALKRMQFLVFSKLEGAMTAGMVHLGDRLGLYRALADAAGPLTSIELAERAGLDERWVREWAYNQAAAGIVAGRTPTSGSRCHPRPSPCSPTQATRRSASGCSTTSRR